MPLIAGSSDNQACHRLIISGGKSASQLVLSNHSDCKRILAVIITGGYHAIESKVRAILESTDRFVYVCSVEPST